MDWEDPDLKNLVIGLLIEDVKIKTIILYSRIMDIYGLMEKKWNCDHYSGGSGKVSKGW